MKAEELVYKVLSLANNNTISGRDRIQKIVYFLNEKLNLGIKFYSYYYGPYSEEVADGLDIGVSFAYVNETYKRIEQDKILHSYELLDYGLIEKSHHDSQIEEIYKICKEYSNQAKSF